MQGPGKVTLAHMQGDHARPAPVAPVGDAAGLLQVLRHQGVPQRVEERRPQLAVPDLHQVEEALHPCSGSMSVYQGNCMASTRADSEAFCRPALNALPLEFLQRKGSGSNICMDPSSFSCRPHAAG